MVRAEFDCVVIAPKLVLERVPFGRPKTTWFSRLKASARNCTVRRSKSLKLLKSDKSIFSSPGPRTSGRVRAVLPNVKGTG